ncbi:MAG TPA: hypothetical protein VL625_06040 [Patescibacteria group bacterium]|nr:hypothetical protein [Patescibacteria group bacterium]
MSEAEAMDILRQDLPTDTKVELDIDDDGSGSIRIKATGAIDETRDFDLVAHRLYPGTMIVTDNGKGLGRHLMRNEIEFFRACGVKRFNIHAGYEAGGYTWARMGFLPDDKDNDYLKKPVRVRYNAVRPLLTDKERQLMDGVVKIRRAKDCWAVADAPIDIGPRLRTLFNEAANGNERAEARFGHLLDSIDSPGYNDKIRDYIIERIKAGKSLPLGRYLLSGSDWTGYLDFEDNTQMRRAGRYVGGWALPPSKPQTSPV